MLKRLAYCLAVLPLFLSGLAQEQIDKYELPGENVFPEGIAYHGTSGRFFVSSAETGALYRGEPGSEQLSVFVAGDSDQALEGAFGLHLDQNDRLWVAGGPHGQVGVYDITSGERIELLEGPTAQDTFLNDLIQAPDGYIYVTDSRQPVLLRAQASEETVGQLEPWLDLTDTPIEYQSGEGPEGTNLNGIVATEDGRYLISVDMNDGKLYRIDLESREVSEIDLGGESLMNGDGLVLDGRTLYVVRLTENEIATVELSEDFSGGTVEARFSDPAFEWPATAALVEGRLLAVNTQFNRQEEGQPELPFTVVSVPVSTVDQGREAQDETDQQAGQEQDTEKQRAEQPQAEERQPEEQRDEVAGGAAAQQANQRGAEEATAELQDSDGNKIGEAIFGTDQDGAVTIQVDISGFTAASDGEHGIHIHETGQCEAPDFKSAGSHFNPTDAQHGLLDPDGPHAGDLPNIEIDADGNASYETTSDLITLADGERSILDDDGSALVIHANRDDQTTDPGGNSGDRIACGVVSAGAEQQQAQAQEQAQQEQDQQQEAQQEQDQQQEQTQQERAQQPGVISDYSRVTDDRLREPEPENWLMWLRTYDAWSYSPLDRINRENVSDLEPVWTFSTGLKEGHEAPLIVNDGIMFMSTPENQVFALDAATGDLIWRYDRDLPHDLFQLHPTNRGVGLYDDKVYLATLDTHVVALDARNGEVLWERAVEDHNEGYYMTLAPLVANGKVMIGVSGGELGIRGFVQAFDAETGEHAWKTYMTPAPGEEGNDTWAGNTWQHGGGSIWITGSYDPDLNLAYWGTGNAAPWTGDARPGDNLYTTSVVALDVDSGDLRAHHQYHWNGSWDWDEVATPLLIDFERDGETVRGLMHAGRNGYLWWLERSEDAISFVDAVPYVEQNVFESIDPETGRPQYNDDAKPAIDQEASFCPSLWGGKDWPPAAFNPDTGYIYIPANTNHCGRMAGIEEQYVAGQTYFGARAEFYIQEGADHIGELQAWNVNTGEQVWVHEFQDSHTWGPVMTTGGGLVFTGGTNDRFFRAFDAETGDVLWQHRTNSGINAVPVSFEVDGVQYIAVQSGWGVDAVRFQGAVAGDQGGHWNIEVPQGGVVWVFALEDATEQQRAEPEEQPAQEQAAEEQPDEVAGGGEAQEDEQQQDDQEGSSSDPEGN